MYVITRLPKSQKVNAVTYSFLSILAAVVGLATQGVDAADGWGGASVVRLSWSFESLAVF